MREMRYIVLLFSKSNNFNEQWILFKAFLNTLHSLSDTDTAAKKIFIRDRVINFSLVLRNILHHQPNKWHFGKHDVYPAESEFLWNETGASFTSKLSLVIQKNTLEDPELINLLYRNGAGRKQVEILEEFTKSMSDHIIFVSVLINYIYNVVENYCKDSEQYDECYDSEPRGYNLIKNPHLLINQA